MTEAGSGADRERIAVVLFNLGGPDAPEAVQPFLFNLFSDPAIITAPQPIRWCLATLIAGRRAPVAREIYARIGGCSPLLEFTREQAAALEAALSDLGAVRAFIAMRYWHPMTEEAVLEVKSWGADRVVLLPLYPQFSTTTTGSSLAAWRRAAAREGLSVETREVCCYPTEPGFVQAHAELIRPMLEAAGETGRPRLLFSAHGLPKKFVDRGDPYVWQVEQTVSAVAGVLAPDFPGLDWRLCYQSRVGPVVWVGPSTEEELAQAGADGVPVVVTPIAFVSEHSETLVELDIDYRRLAREKHVPAYHRVPALGNSKPFISALAALVHRALGQPRRLCSQSEDRLCPMDRTGCPYVPDESRREA